MEQILAIAGFITVAVITPGPNNFIVLNVAARRGLLAAAPAIGGVIAGSLLLLLVIWAGASTAFAAEPRARSILAVMGALYLAYLGGTLIWRAGQQTPGEVENQDNRLPRTALGLTGFQFLNPKSWVLILTATAASPATPVGLTILAALFIVIPGICLTLWAGAGAAISCWLKRPAPGRWFDRIMGALLIASALLLFI